MQLCDSVSNFREKPILSAREQVLIWTDTVISLCLLRPVHGFAGWLNCGKTMLCSTSQSLQRSEKKPLGSVYYGLIFFFFFCISMLERVIEFSENGN